MYETCEQHGKFKENEEKANKKNKNTRIRETQLNIRDTWLKEILKL